MTSSSRVINKAFDGIDYGLNYIGVQLLKLPTFKILNVKITPKIQTAMVFVAGAFVGSIRISNVFAHAGHGDEEAENLGSTTLVQSGDIFVNPKEVKTDAVMNQSYPGIILSDEYGSIFSSLGGLVTKLHVNLGDKVKKGQAVATVGIVSNSPEIIGLLAGKKADIAVSQGQLNAANNVVNYLKSQAGASGNAMQNVYDQKRRAIDISIDTQKQQLQIRVDSLKAQMNAKRQLVEAERLTSQSTIDLNSEKQISLEKSLEGSIQNAIAKMGKVFARSEITTMGFDEEFRNNESRGVRDSAQRNTYLALVTQLISQYSNWDTLSTIEKLALGELAERTLKEGIALLGVSAISSTYSETQLNTDIGLLITAYSNEETGITTLLSKYKELQKQLVGSNATASGGIIQANADLAGLDQEIILLSKEIDLLDAEKNKELAELEGEQSIRGFDVQQLIIGAESEIIKAQAELEANKNALGAIQATSKSTTVTAPFAGTISRKNVVIGQSIEPTVPLFDIVGLNSTSKSFVRFEVPVGEYNKLSIGQPLQIGLGGDQPLFAGSILRIAQSVNKDTQTLTIEGTFEEEISPYPLGTNIRVSSQGLSGVTVVEIPNTAIKQDEEGKSFVYKVLSTNTLKQWYITIAYTEGEKSYINEGLKGSDTIIANIYEGEREDGMTVEIDTK